MVTLTFLLCAVGVVGVEPSSFATDAPTAPTQELVAPNPGFLTQSLSGDAPHMHVSRLLLDSAKTMARPVLYQPGDWWILGGMVVGAAVAVNVDVEVHRAIKTIPDPILLDHQLSYWGSMLGEGWVDLSIVLLVGLIGDRSRVVYAGLEALVACAVVSRLAKLVFRLERPSYDTADHHWFNRDGADAMPSGHAMSAFATAAVLSSEWPYLSPLFFGLAAYVGLARMQQSTHWLSDVVVGAGLGTLFGLEAWRLTRQWELDVQPWLGAGGGGVIVSRRF